MASRRNLRTLLLSGFAMVIALLSVTFGLAWYFLNNAQKVARDVAIDDVPGSFLYLRMLGSASNMQTSVLEYLAGEQEEFNDFKMYFKAFQSDYASLVPLEAENASNVQKMAEIKSLIEEYRTDITRHVFEVFNPDNESWAFTTVSELTRTTGQELEWLLNKLVEEEFTDALKTESIEEAVKDDLPGVRYYLEMVDEAGDMLADLLEYVAGNPSKSISFDENADSFLEYYNLLIPIEQKGVEIENLQTIKKLYNHIISTSLEIFERYDSSSKLSAIKRVDELEHDSYKRLIQILSDSASEEQDDATSSLRSLTDGIKNTVLALILSTISSTILAIIIALFLSRLILNALTHVVQISEAISTGDIEYAKKRIELKNNNRGKGIEIIKEFDDVRISLSKTLDDLMVTGENNKRQNWLKSGLNELNRKLSGELPMEEIAKISVDFISQYIDATVGFIYRRGTEKGPDNITMVMAAHYGVAINDYNRNMFPEVYESGDGLVGQCLLEQKIISKIISFEHRKPIIQSGIAQAEPSYVVVVPLKFEDVVEGVIELGTERELSKAQFEFVEKLSQNLGIAMRVATSRDRMSALLSQGAQQSNKLEKQQTLLSHTNEQLSEKAQLLLDQQEVLQDRNTALEKTRKSLEKQTEELESSNRYKSEFLANMSHELRSPLNSLLILSKLLQSNSEGNLTEKQISYAEVIHRSGSNLLVLINDILDLSKIESGKMELFIEDCPTLEIVRATRELFDYMAREKGIDFCVIDKTKSRTIRTDRKRLQQILTNLVSNAIKFTNSGNVALTIERLSKGAKDIDQQVLTEHTICYHVHDTGIGIAKGIQKDVFNAFCQGDGTTQRSYEGTGLGLSIALKMSRALGGYILLKSELGIGTDLYVYLPESVGNKQLEYDGGTAAIESQESIRNSAFSVNTDEAIFVDSPALDDCATGLTMNFDNTQETTLVLVSSDVDIQTQMKQEGEKHGYQVITAPDSGYGLQFAQQLKPSAIILDEDASYIDSHLLLEKLKASTLTRHIPVHMIVSNDRHAKEIMSGAYSTSPRPIAAKDICETLEKLGSCGENRIIIVSPSDDVLKELRRSLENPNTEIQHCHSANELQRAQGTDSYDCVIISLDNEKNTHLLPELLQIVADLTTAPALVHSSSSLSQLQSAALDELAETFSFVTLIGSDSLFFETSLFLHQAYSSLSFDQQALLNRHLSTDNICEGKNLLVVDDQISNVFAMAAILETNGMLCTIANNGSEALSLLENNTKFDLILVDIMMPEMDGYETMRRIRSKSRLKHVPIIALTAKAMKKDREKCIAAGANDYLSKPLTSVKLLQLLKMWLACAPNRRKREGLALAKAV